MNKEILREKLFTLLGQVSMAWSETPSGIFEDKYVQNLGNEFIKWLENNES